MTNPSEAPPPGSYYAPGDPFGTQRYWDGAQWVGGPVPIQPPPGYQTPGYVPARNRPLATPGQRIVARLLDGLIIGVPVVIVALVVLLSRASHALDSTGAFSPAEYLALTLPFAAPPSAYHSLP